ncbi:unnamed protein product [Cyclocybe aegerita]|uniref:Uncharacterized protein n=1 Tax=Cyclocybe aegerita TaxID=1973307 RepID=A0A8S0WJ26_CYCAE|nr:unnamed protein product [Cyclocybe aegerita]
MTRLSEDIPFPGQLAHEPAPQAEAVVSGVDAWVVYQLKNNLLRGVHYENQLYGHWNAYLYELFPSRRRFMITPQAIIRTPVAGEGEPEDIDDADRSFGSTGAIFESRNLPGFEECIKYPDFVPFKEVPQVDGEIIHHPITIVEVKRDLQGLEDGHSQMVGYMTTAARHRNTPRTLRGFLLGGHHLKVYTIQTGIEGAEPEVGDRRDILVPQQEEGSYDIALELAKLAAERWNEVAA